MEDFREVLDDMPTPNLVAARLHLDTYRLSRREYKLGERLMWLPVHQHLQILQLNLWDVDDDVYQHITPWPEYEGPIEYDLSVMPSLKWAIFIGPYLHLPDAIPRSLSKLLLVSNNKNDDNYHFQCDLSW